MPSRLHDARIRGWVALGVASVFFCVPALVVIALFAKWLQIKDLEPILKTWTLYMGPLTGVVFGYYFGSLEDRRRRSDNDDTG